MHASVLLTPKAFGASPGILPSKICGIFIRPFQAQWVEAPLCHHTLRPLFHGYLLEMTGFVGVMGWMKVGA